MLKDKIREQRDRINVMLEEKEGMARLIAAKEDQIRVMQDEFKQ